MTVEKKKGGLIRSFFIGMLEHYFHYQSFMRISFIGSGKVATHLARGLAKQHQIVQVFSRNLDHARQLAEQFNAEPIDHYHDINSQIDLIIIAVSDQAITETIVQLAPYLSSSLVVHTSGSTALNILSQHYSHAGVLYPLQTFSFEREIDWQATPIFIEATEAKNLEILKYLANSLSQRIYNYSSAQRLSLHLAAVFACNFTNYCYDLAKQIVDQQQVDFSLLYPLISETAQKALQHDPHLIQTGPAVRGDQNILNMHMQLLNHAEREDLREIYQVMSQSILKSHQCIK